MKEELINLLDELSESKIISLIYYARFLKEQPDELDAYDYELAKQADEILKKGEESIPLDKVLEELKLNDTQNQNTPTLILEEDDEKEIQKILKEDEWVTDINI